MTTLDTPDRPAPVAWSRRPFVGSLPKGFLSRLPADAVRERLASLANGPDTIGATDANGGWLRLRAGPSLPASTLRLTVESDDAGARLTCRYDSSRWDSIDLWIWAGAAAAGFNVAAMWFGGAMPPGLRDRLMAATPPAMATVALVALAHYGFRRWRQTVRNRLFDTVIVALGVPIE